jgi:hypothetical protein
MTDSRPELKLVGTDGNAFALLGKAAKVARANGLDAKAIMDEAMDGDYNHLLRTLHKYFEVT